MEKLLEKIDNLEQFYLTKRQYLFKLKIFALFLGLISLMYCYLKVYFLGLKFKLTLFEINGIELLVSIVVMTPIIATPLNKFLSSKTNKKLNWDIKSSVFFTVLDKYNAEFRFSFDNNLPSSDLKNMKLENGFTTFAFCGNLIIGEINRTRFRISDVHSMTLFQRKFDGIVGVLIFNDLEDAKAVYKIMEIDLSKEFSIHLIRNKVYMTCRGNKDNFKFEFINNRINREKLISDYRNFEDFVGAFLSEICIYKISHKQ